MAIDPSITQVARYYETDGVPSSGAHQIKKSDFIQWGLAIEAAATAALSASKLPQNEQTGTAYTIDLEADLGVEVRGNNASAQTFTLPNVTTDDLGFICPVRQVGAGQITFVLAAGGSPKNEFSEAKTAGKWAPVLLSVELDDDGVTPAWVLSGRTGS